MYTHSTFLRESFKLGHAERLTSLVCTEMDPNSWCRCYDKVFHLVGWYVYALIIIVFVYIYHLLFMYIGIYMYTHRLCMLHAGCAYNQCILHS